DSGAAANLKLDSGTLFGGISGPVSIEIDGTVSLVGASTYTGTTTIDPAGSLHLGNTSNVGSVAGAIVDNGSLTISSPSSITVSNPISGTGGLIVASQTSSIVFTFNQANAFTGGTDLFFGTDAVGNAAAFGSGALAMEFGILEATQTETITNLLSLSSGPA